MVWPRICIVDYANPWSYLARAPELTHKCTARWYKQLSKLRERLANGIPPRKMLQVLHISNKRNPLKYNYNIHGHILEETDTSKYLGINLIRTLSWNNHINTVAKKASNISAFLQRNLHQLPKKSKSQCYQISVRPLMEYACTIWDPHTLLFFSYGIALNILNIIFRRMPTLTNFEK